ncbi:DUF2510 domain-containing protein [Microbacterium trichothecenolyticum]|uniref:DUF2510 domain-containing protein n=1 Tax=Microbacterium trichothecenolyticum TaxID=69370 RepID=UPI00358EE9A9
MTENAPQAPAGWYADRSMPGVVRYWNGRSWTARTRRIVAAPRVAARAHSGPRPQASQPNYLGLAAIALAVLGFGLACSRALFLVGFAYPVMGFALLAVALVLGVIAACLRGRAKWPGVVAIVVAIVGTFVGIVLSLIAAALSSGIGYR